MGRIQSPATCGFASIRRPRTEETLSHTTIRQPASRAGIRRGDKVALRQQARARRALHEQLEHRWSSRWVVDLGSRGVKRPVPSAQTSLAAAWNGRARAISCPASPVSPQSRPSWSVQSWDLAATTQQCDFNLAHVLNLQNPPYSPSTLSISTSSRPRPCLSWSQEHLASRGGILDCKKSTLRPIGPARPARLRTPIRQLRRSSAQHT